MTNVVRLQNKEVPRSNALMRSIIRIPDVTSSKSRVGVNFPLSKTIFYRFYLIAVSALHEAQKTTAGTTKLVMDFNEVRDLLKLRRSPYIANEGKANEMPIHWHIHTGEMFRSFCQIALDSEAVDEKDSIVLERTDVVFTAVEWDVEAETVTFEFNPQLVPEILANDSHYSKIDMDIMLSLSSFAQMRMYDFLCTYKPDIHAPKIDTELLKRFLGYGPLVPYKKLKNQYLKGIQKKLAEKADRTFTIRSEIKNSEGIVGELRFDCISSGKFKGHLFGGDANTMEKISTFKGLDGIVASMKAKHNFQKGTIMSILRQAHESGMSARKLKSLSTEEVRKRFL